MQIRVLKTQDLILDHFIREDARAMYDGWGNSEAVTRWMFMRPGLTMLQCMERVDALMESYGKTGDNLYQWAIREQGVCIGSIALFVDSGHNSGRFAYFLTEENWSKGYGTQALMAVISFAFESLGLNRMEADHFLENPASGRVMQKAGMQQEGIARGKYFKNSSYHDVAMYAILKEDWEKY